MAELCETDRLAWEQCVAFGAAVRTVRKARGWDQAELARRSGVSRETVNRVENAMYGARLDNVVKLMIELGCTLTIEENR